VSPEWRGGAGVDMEGCNGREENDKDLTLFKPPDASRYTSLSVD